MTTKSADRTSALDTDRAAAPFAIVTGASTGIGLPWPMNVRPTATIFWWWPTSPRSTTPRVNSSKPR